MAVSSVTLLSEARSRDGATFRGTRRYRVEFDADEFSIGPAITANDGTESIPSVGDSWSAGSALEVVGYSADNRGDPRGATVDVSYSSDQDEQDSATEDPTTVAARITARGADQTVPYFRDESGTPKLVTNSAGQAFNELPERIRPEGVEFQIVRRVSTKRTSTLWSLYWSLNNASVTIDGDTLAAGEAALSDFGYSEKKTVEKNDGTTVTFFEETIKIIARPSWDDVFEDRGLDELDAGELVQILDKDGNPVTKPYPLDGSGAAKANPTDEPAQITFKPYAQKSWAAITPFT